MTVETEISTPAENVEDVDTSLDSAPVDTDTAEQEPTQQENAAETETKPTVEEAPAELYAGKYKTVDDLVKGYKEAEKLISRSNDFEKKYNALLQEQETRAEQIAQERLRQAQQSGYRTAEEQEIDTQIKLAEYQYYAQGLNNVVNPEYLQEVSALLSNYYSTGHKAYLDEAKRYFTSDFIEEVANGKARYEQYLRGEYQSHIKAQKEAQESKLAEEIRAEYGEFLQDIQTNVGKAQALKTFCDVGSITSKADMQVFHSIYNQIAQYERAQAIKELEAQKVIEEAKNKAVIGSGSQATGEIGGLKESYTQAEVDAMTQAEFDTLYGKHKDKFLQRIK
jgi:hypothetical protein